MLWALALLGILPAAFVFGDSGADEPDSDSERADAEGDSPSDGAPMSDVLSAEGDAAEDDVQPLSHNAVSDGGETTFDDFCVGEDEITLHLTDDGSGDFFVETLQNEDGEDIGVSLCYLDGEIETTLNFPNLTEVPAEDITIGITSQETGDEIFYSLEDMGNFGAVTPNDPDEPATQNSGGVDDLVMTPNDPDTPAIAVGQGEADDEGIAPSTDDGPEVFDHSLADGGDTLVLNDDPFQGGFDAEIVMSGDTATIETEHGLHRISGSDDGDTIVLGDDAAIVQGGAGDDTIYAGEGTAIVSSGAGDDSIFGGNDSGSDYLLDGGAGDDDLSGGDASETLVGGLGADSVSGGGGDDTLILDSQDVASGGAGADTFWVYDNGEADDGSAQIIDFAPGEDIIRISLPPEAEQSDDFSVDVTPTADGTGSQVSVNGDVVAVLHGAPHVTSSDIVVDYDA